MSAKIGKSIDIHEFLSNLEVDEKEIDVYLQLLEIGSTPIGDLSRKTDIPKTTLYRIINKLQEKSLVTKTEKNEIKLLTAESPERLGVLIKDKQAEAKSALNHLDEMSEHLPLVVKTILESAKPEIEENPPLVKYYEGVHGFRAVSNRSLEKAQNEVLQISNCSEWRKVFTKDYSMKNYVPERLKKNIALKALVIDNRPGQEFKQQGETINRETRFLPKGTQFRSTILIYNGEVSIMVSSRPYSAVLLQSYDIYEMAKSLFNIIWSQTGSDL